MALSTKTLKLLDQQNYCAAGTSLDKLLDAYLTGVKKFFFPYEWYVSPLQLQETQLPAKDAFWSSLKSCNTLGKTEEEINANYEFCQRVWVEEEMKCMEDFLVYYNKSDVVPFTKAAMKSKEIYKAFGIDMYKDAVSLPGCAEKTMFKMAMNTTSELPIVKPAKPLSLRLVRRRIASYIEQDKKRCAEAEEKRLKQVEKEAARAEKKKKKVESDEDDDDEDDEEDEEDEEDDDFIDNDDIDDDEFSHAAIDNAREEEEEQEEEEQEQQETEQEAKPREFMKLVEDAANRCTYCAIDLSKNNFKNLSFDRIDNSIGHVCENLVVCCTNCNVTRKTTPFHTFLSRTLPKRVDAVSPQIHIIDEKNKQVFHELKNSIAGGPSVIFHRHHKVGETFIKKARYDLPMELRDSPFLNTSMACAPKCTSSGWRVEVGQLVKSIVGYDANALYLWCLSQDMPCGKLIFKDPSTNNLNNDLVNWMEFAGWEAYIAENPGRAPYRNTWTKAVNSVRSCSEFLTAESDFKKIKDIGENINLIIMQAPFSTFVERTMSNEAWKIDTDDKLEKMKTDEFFGFMTVDIEVPEKLYDKFAEFPPIFTNGDVREQSEYMSGLRERLSKKLPKKNRKLVSVMKAQKICLYTPLLKWYVEHGLVVTKVHSYITAKKNAPFKSFTEWVSDCRRAGDVDPSQQVKAEMAKTIGNSSFGRSVMNLMKHFAMHYTTSEKKASKAANDWTFRGMSEIAQSGGGIVFETKNMKKKIKQNTPYQVGSAIYQLAKLRMLMFYYDVLAKYLDPMVFQLLEMDTDSFYMALVAMSLEELVKPEMRAAFEAEKHLWFPDVSTAERRAYTKRTPGLFKVEATGTEMVCLTSKSYFLAGKNNKSALKGVQSRNNTELICLERYKQCLFAGDVQSATNRGFRMWDNVMQTYSMRKDGLSPIYDKRLVMADGVTTMPLVSVE